MLDHTEAAHRTEGQTMTRSLTVTPFTIVDGAGNPLCHSASSDRARMDSKRKREARALFALMAKRAGAVTSNGRWTCAITGERGYRNTEERAMALLAGERGDDAHMWDLIDAGHVVPDEDGGPMCPCNLVPQLRRSNLLFEDMGNMELTKHIRHEVRHVWHKVLLDYLTGTGERKDTNRARRIMERAVNLSL